MIYGKIITNLIGLFDFRSVKANIQSKQSFDKVTLRSILLFSSSQSHFSKTI